MNLYEINVVSGDAEANFTIPAASQRDAILIAAKFIANKKISWKGIPDTEWEFISIFDVGESENGS